MKQIRDYFRNGLTILIIFVYIFVMAFQFVPFINIIDVVNAENSSEKDNLVLVFVDSNVYNDIKPELSWYTSYIQQGNKNTKPILFPIDTSSVTALDIQKVISNLYFDGEQSKTSFLNTVVLIGDIPLPVVNKDGFIFTTIYPYVDLVNPAFVYDNGTRYFKYTGKNSNTELAHGVIKFDNNSEYKAYFQKLRTYASDPSSFVEKKFYIDHFVAQKKAYNKGLSKYYLNRLLFAENLITKKITPLILEVFNKQNQENYDDIMKGVNNPLTNEQKPTFNSPVGAFSSFLGFDESNTDEFKNIQEEYASKTQDYFGRMKSLMDRAKNQKNDYRQMLTLVLELTLEGFFKNYVGLYGSEYPGNLTKNIEATGRYTWTNSISSLNTIDLKDNVSVNFINIANKTLEQNTDSSIEGQKLFMNYPVLDYYIEDPDWKDSHTTTQQVGDQVVSSTESKTYCMKRYENFYFGSNVQSLTTEANKGLKMAHIFRGSYNNLTDVDGFYSTSSRGKASMVSTMENAFDTQTEMNRGYNTLLAKKDGDDYKNLCPKPMKACLDLGRYTNGENVEPWAHRIYGGYSPLNLEVGEGGNDMKLKNADPKYAWHPSYAPKKNGSIFNLAGSFAVKKEESTKNTDYIDGFTNYSAVWQTYKNEKKTVGHGDDATEECVTVHSHGASKVAGQLYKYLDDFDTIYENAELGDKRCEKKNIEVNGDNITIRTFYGEGRSDGECSTRPYRVFNFKFLDTRVKHTSPTDEEFDGFNMTTKARPVDSSNYITFLGVDGKGMKFLYPDLFKVELYKEEGGQLVLKSPNEIDASVRSYLKGVVNSYNEQIGRANAGRTAFENQYKKAYSHVSSDVNKPHPVSGFSEDYFINILGDEKIANISEMLYYLNLGWKIRPSFSTLSGELDYLYKNFNVNEKIDYVVGNYMDAETPYKIGNIDVKDKDVNFPSKANNGYEAGFIGSQKLDGIPKTDSNSDFGVGVGIPDGTSVNNRFAFDSFQSSNLPLDASANNKEECGRPLGEAVMLFEWPAAFMCRLQETMKKPFKIGSTSECSDGSCSGSVKDFVNKLKDSGDSFVNEWKEFLGMTTEQANDKQNKDYTIDTYSDNTDKKEKFNKLKDLVDYNIVVDTDKKAYDYDDYTGSINITNYGDTSLIDSIKVRSYTLTGNCFFIKNKNSSNYTNTCNGTYEIDKSHWKIPFYFFNPKTSEGKYYSYKAGQKIIVMDFCTSDNTCYTKRVFFDKMPGKLSYVEIKPFSNTMVYGGQNPFVIEGFDSKPGQGRFQNEINATYYNYKLSLTPSVGVIQSHIGQQGYPTIDYNFTSSDKLMVIKTDKSSENVASFKISLDLDKSWKDTLADETDILEHAESDPIYISPKQTLSNSDVVMSPANYSLPQNPYDLIVEKDGVKFYNKSKLPKLHVAPKVNGKIIKTPFSVKDKNGNFIVGTFVKRKNTIKENGVRKIVEFEEFVKQNKFLIKDDSGVDVYLLPTFETGPYDVLVEIPGVNTYSINGSFDSFPPEKIFIKLDKYEADPGEVVNGKIFALDKFGNLQENISSAQITTTDGLQLTLNGNDVKVQGTESGFIQMKIGDFENNVKFNINNTFIPYKKKLSVMYLTLLGYDWGKYSSYIMSNSDKNLAITTTSQDPKKIQKFDYLLSEDIRVSSNFDTKISLKPNGIVFNIGRVNLNYSGNFFSNIQNIDSIDKINKNGIYYIKEQTDSVIQTNILNADKIYVNGSEVINFSNLTQNDSILIYYNKALTKRNGLAIYDIVFKNKKLGILIFRGNVLDFSKMNVSKSILSKIIYGDGSTNGVKAYGLIMNYEKYSGIGKNTEIDVASDEGLGFRSNYRNITDFAGGLNVGEASKSFQNEFIINYGDPFVKRISSEKVMKNVNVSKTYGHKIYSDIAGGINKVVPIDFNNDGLKDIAILYNNSSIRFLKNYKGQKHFQDLGNLMLLSKSATNIFAGDYDGDGYQDLFVQFSDNTVRIYKNDHGVFSVDPYPICLDVAGSVDGMNYAVEQIFFRDMNNDGKTDIVTNDLTSNVKVFFGPTYASDNMHKCPSNRKFKLSQKLVKSYSYQVSSDQQFMDDGYIYRQGLNDQENGVLMRPLFQEAFKTQDFSKIPQNDGINPSNYNESVMSQGSDKFAYQDIPKAFGPSFEDIKGDTVEFKKGTFLIESDPVGIYKTMEDLNGGNLNPGDKVRITVHVNNKQNKKLTYLETLKGPFGVISKNDEPILKYTGIGPDNITFPKEYKNFLFRVDNAPSSFTVSYEAYFQGSSSIKIKVDDFTKNDYGDIKVFLNNGCIKGYDFFKGKPGNPMDFDYSYENVKEKLVKKITGINKKSDTEEVIADAKSGKYDKLLDKFKINSSKDAFNSEEFTKTIMKGGQLDVNVSMGGGIGAIKSQVDKMLQGLCKGFSFSKADCGGGIPIPCNYAFLAPGTINVCGCAGGTDPGTPIFWYPGTLWFSCPKCSCTAPVPMMKTKTGPPIEKAAPSGCNTPPVYDSKIRLYLAPTLTMGLGFAACFGSYQKGMKTPVAPLGAIAGNCVVVAADVSGGSCEDKPDHGEDSDDESEEDQLDDWMNDLDNGVCSDLSFFPGTHNFSSLGVPNGTSFAQSSISPMNGGKITALNGMVKFEMTAHKVNSVADGEVLMEGGMPFTLNTEQGTFKGIIQCIIKKWMNKQIQFLISNLTHMTLYITYPDMKGLLKGFDEKAWAAFDFDGSSFNEIFTHFRIGESSNLANSSDSGIYKTISKYLPSKDGLKAVSKGLNSPFDAVKSYLEEIPLINVSIKTVAIKVPWIGKDEIDKQITYMKNRINKYKTLIESCASYVQGEEAGGGCELITTNFKAFVKSVQRNIDILEQYRNFPLQLEKYMHALDKYLTGISCMIDKYVDMIVGWLNRNSKIFEKRVDAIVAIINAIRTWQLLIDVSLNWKMTCGKCRVDAGDLYDCTLSGLCIDLPVLPIPPFKIPDIYVDFSHINLGIDVILPKIKIYPVPIGMFTLPEFSAPSVNIKFPTLPSIPLPPTLPELPCLPAIPTVELPNLPPPPKIPELMPAIKAVLEVFKLVTYFRCIIKNGIGLVAEWNVKTRIEQLTARHNRIFPFDFLNIDFPVLPFKGFDVKVDAYLNYRVELSMIYDAVKSIADGINKKTSNSIGKMLQVNVENNNKMNSLNKKGKVYNINLDLHSSISPKEKRSMFVINKEMSTNVAKSVLYNELLYFISQKGQDYLNSVSDANFKKAENIIEDTVHNPKVTDNSDSVRNIHKQFNELMRKQYDRMQKINDVFEQMRNGKEVDTSDSDLFVKPETNLVNDIYGTPEEKFTFKAKILSLDEKSEKILRGSENPKLSYMKMYGKALNKFKDKLEFYKAGKPEKYYVYDEMQRPVEKALAIVDVTVGKEYAMSTTSSLSSSSALTTTSTSIPAPSASSPDMVADPTQNIKGLFMRGANNIYYNVMKDKEKGNKIRIKNDFVLEDINNDSLEDMVWYDAYSVYIKYTKDEPEDNGIIYSTKYIYNGIITDFSKIVDNDGYITLSDSKFKIWDRILPINDLNLGGQTFDNFRLGWTKTSEFANSYTVIYSQRIDILNDIEKKFGNSSEFTYAGKNFKTNAIVFYNKEIGSLSGLNESNIQISGINPVSVQFVPLDFKNKEKFRISLYKDYIKTTEGWKYFRIYNSNVELQSKRVNILSSYSNQEVGSEQFIGDNTTPILTTELIRNKTNKIIGTGINLKAYVNTSYTLRGTWEDDSGIDSKFITDEQMNFIQTGDSIQVGPDQEIGQKTYYFVARDLNGNIAKTKVTVNITIPKIKISDIDTQKGIVESQVLQDMDNSAVKYSVDQNGIPKFIKNLQGYSVFTGGVGKTVFTGSIFDNTKQIILHDKDGNSIGNLNLNDGDISINNSDFYLMGTLDTGVLTYNVYDSSKKKVFSIKLPIKGQTQTPIMFKTNEYILREIDNSNLGTFNGGYCIYGSTEKTCVIYISKTGLIFAPEIYKDSFIADYKFNNGIISSTFYKTSVPDKSSLTDENKLFTIWYKAKNMSK